MQTNVEKCWWTVQVKMTSHLAPAHRLIRMSPIFTDRRTGQQMRIWKGRKERMRGASPPAALPDDKVDLQLMRLWTVRFKCAAHLVSFHQTARTRDVIYGSFIKWIMVEI